MMQPDNDDNSPWLQLARLRSEREAAVHALTMASRALDDLSATLARTRALLREVEWQPGGLCACCGCRTHTAACELHALLTEGA